MQHLKVQLLGKIANPINPCNRKVLIFTAFADAADYLYANLAPELLAKLAIHTAKVSLIFSKIVNVLSWFLLGFLRVPKKTIS